MYYKNHERYKDGNFTLFPNEALSMDLSMGEICVYLYLLYCEDRKTYSCCPSLEMICNALQTSKPTVRKYIESLEKRGMIYTEPTELHTKKYGRRNGRTKYFILPMKNVIDSYLDKKIREQEAKLRAQEALSKYDKKHSKRA